MLVDSLLVNIFASNIVGKDVTVNVTKYTLAPGAVDTWKLNILLAKLTAFSKEFTIGDWVLDGTTYKQEIVHNLNDRNILVTFWDNTYKQVFAGVSQSNSASLFTYVDATPDCRFSGSAVLLSINGTPGNQIYTSGGGGGGTGTVNNSMLKKLNVL
jgi:hypothetical protein